MNTPIRILIADDHALFRQGLKSLLDLQPELVVVAEIDRADTLAAAVATAHPDIVLLDLQMDRWAADEIESLVPCTSVIVLTASERIEDALGALRAGARAIVQKRFAVETLMEAIRAVADGLVWIPPAIQAQVMTQWGTPRGERLTAREIEIARAVAAGSKNAEIAAQLSISESTVKTHLNNIFQKLGVRDRVELAMYAVKSGLISMRDETR
ncbi:MAG TPA: response regulator transcription factor [Candidatus Binataceae bacterium]|nr:response regulator transcription factor [Candidatus Binataceae bacterium]